MTTTVPASMVSADVATQAELDATVAAAKGPAFSAFSTGTQTITAATWTKITLGSENFDTAGAFDSTTNYRFTPLVAGYYQVSLNLNLNATSALTTAGASIYKNGTAYAYSVGAGASTTATVPLSALVLLNGSTDYIEAFGYAAGTGTMTVNGGAAANNVFSAGMVRAL